MFEWIRFCWSATRGHRLRPWKSPYVRWRVETYTGMKAESVDFVNIADLVWKERFQMIHFMRWIGAMRGFRQPQR